MLSSLLFGILLILAFLLQPIQILLGIVIRFLWHPPALSTEMQAAEPGTEDIKTLFVTACQNLDMQWLRSHWDAGKFLSMYAWATNSPSAWQDVMSMVDEQAGTLHRNPRGFWKQSVKTFSGDQLSGWMGAVANRIAHIGLSAEEKRRISIVWENISFSGFPMIIPHYVTGKSLKLGVIWRPWQVWNSASIIKLMTWLLIGREVTGKRSCSALFYLVYVLFFPALLLASPDGEIFLGKFYACSANASHSLMLDLTTGYILQKPWIFKMLMSRIGKKREKWTEDWLALWGAYFGELTEEQEKRLLFLVQSLSRKGIGDNASLTADYFDLVHFERQSGFPEIESPEIRCCDYTDERHITVPENWWCVTMLPFHTAIDLIFPAGITLNQKRKK